MTCLQPGQRIDSACTNHQISVSYGRSKPIAREAQYRSGRNQRGENWLGPFVIGQRL